MFDITQPSYGSLRDRCCSKDGIVCKCCFSTLVVLTTINLRAVVVYFGAATTHPLGQVSAIRFSLAL